MNSCRGWLIVKELNELRYFHRKPANSCDVTVCRSNKTNFPPADGKFPPLRLGIFNTCDRVMADDVFLTAFGSVPRENSLPALNK